MDIQRASRGGRAGIDLPESNRQPASADDVVILHPAPDRSAQGQDQKSSALKSAPGLARQELRSAPGIAGAVNGFKRLIDRAGVWLKQNFSWSWHKTQRSAQAREMALSALSSNDRAGFRASNVEALGQDLAMAARDRAERSGDGRVWRFITTGRPIDTGAGPADPAQARKAETTRKRELTALMEAVAEWTAGADALESGNLGTQHGREATRLSLAVLDAFASVPGMTAGAALTLLQGVDRKAEDPLRELRIAALTHAEPNMSPPRAGLLIDFASPRAEHPVEMARTMCQPPSRRTGFDRRGVAEGSTYDETMVPADFQPHHQSRVVSTDRGLALAGAPETSPHHALLQNFSASKVPRTVRLTSGKPLVLNEALVGDCERATFVVNNQLMPRGHRQSFLDAYRAQFPAGPKGDAIASLVSDCANQFSVHPLHALIAQRTFGPADRNISIVYETWQDKGGDWTVRCSMLIRFPIATRGVGPDASEPFDMAKGSATLQTVTFRIQPDPFDEAPPRVMGIESEVVFTGGPAAASAQAS